MKDTASLPSAAVHDALTHARDVLRMIAIGVQQHHIRARDVEFLYSDGPKRVGVHRLAVEAMRGLEQEIAARAAQQALAPSMPDGVWEALQRLIENAATMGPGSREDALLVAKWRGQFVAAPSVQPTDSRHYGAALGRLAQEAFSPSVPEVTDAMLDKALVAFSAWSDTKRPRDRLRDALKAMLAAAPAPQVAPAVQPMTDELLTQMRQVHEAQGRDGNWNMDSYMSGMFNGMELMLSIAEKREPQFRKRDPAQQVAPAVQPDPFVAHFAQEEAAQAHSYDAGVQPTEGWIRMADRRPAPGTLIAKRWRYPGSVWAGIYSGTDKDSSFDEWCALPVASAPTTERAWQPIETAPKDGRALLLGHFNSHGKWRTVRGAWCSADAIAETWEEEAEEGWYEMAVEADDTPNAWQTTPSHWMPLPPPPTEASAGEKQQ